MSKSNTVCPRCGEAFVCAMQSGEAACWCAAYPAAFEVPKAGEGGACYCPRCLAELIEARRAQMAGMHCRPLRPR
ncbi:MAG: cysteine-rich CWC family protein [Tepidiphilus sp.]|jgi:hypothetical protein